MNKFEYMDDLDYRYEIASEWIKPHHRNVVEINSGNSRFRDYAKKFGAFYISNDVSDSRSDLRMTDLEFAKSKQMTRMDVLVSFGIGGHDYKSSPYESPTQTNTIIDLIWERSPEYVIIESTVRCSFAMDRIQKETGYEILFSKKTFGNGDWKFDRELRVLGQRTAVTHQRYQRIANRVQNGYTIKMDAWQESRNRFPIKANLYVELKQEVIESAIRKGFKNVIHGDIRSLPIETNSVDTLIDTSTIDHIPNFTLALNEYFRVLKYKTGKIFIAAWTTQGDTFKANKKDGAGGDQYFFNQKEFTYELLLRFPVIHEAGELLNRVGNTVSYWVVGK
jgi:hypothetical protein